MSDGIGKLMAAALGLNTETGEMKPYTHTFTPQVAESEVLYEDDDVALIRTGDGEYMLVPTDLVEQPTKYFTLTVEDDGTPVMTYF